MLPYHCVIRRESSELPSVGLTLHPSWFPRQEVEGSELQPAHELNYGAVAKAIVDLSFRGYPAHVFVPSAKDQLKALGEAAKLCDA
jgi:hypothetical protein